MDLVVPGGSIFGLIGPNGAGKSTTFSMIATLLQPTSGELTVLGVDPSSHPRDVRRGLGYMPDVLGVYDNLRVDEYLQFFAATYHIPRRQWPELIGGLLELVDLVAEAVGDGQLAVPGHEAAAQPGPHARPRPRAAGARRAGQRSRPPCPCRAPRAAARPERDGQDDHHLQPHPRRARGGVHGRGDHGGRPAAGVGPAAADPRTARRRPPHRRALRRRRPPRRSRSPTTPSRPPCCAAWWLDDGRDVVEFVEQHDGLEQLFLSLTEGVVQ